MGGMEVYGHSSESIGGQGVGTASQGVLALLSGRHVLRSPRLDPPMSLRARLILHKGCPTNYPFPFSPQCVPRRAQCPPRGACTCRDSALTRTRRPTSLFRAGLSSSGVRTAAFDTTWPAVLSRPAHLAKSILHTELGFTIITKVVDATGLWLRHIGAIA